MKSILKKPYHLLESKRFRYLLVYGIAGFAFIFLWIFEPFKIYSLEPWKKFVSLLLSIGSGLPLSIAHFFYLQNKFIKKYTIGTTIVWIGLSFFIIGFCVFFVNVFLFKDGEFSIIDFLFFQGVVFTVNIIPISIVVLIHYNYLIKKRLKEVNNQISNVSGDSINKSEKMIVLKSKNKNNNLKLKLDSLLYITSADNYVNVCYLDNQIVKNKLLRSSLSQITNSLDCCPELFRCHKSYIVNKDKIEAISGNAAGYKIKLKNYNDLIPVSRNHNKSVQEFIRI